MRLRAGIREDEKESTRTTRDADKGENHRYGERRDNHPFFEIRAKGAGEKGKGEKNSGVAALARSLVASVTRGYQELPRMEINKAPLRAGRVSSVAQFLLSRWKRGRDDKKFYAVSTQYACIPAGITRFARVRARRFTNGIIVYIASTSLAQTVISAIKLEKYGRGCIRDARARTHIHKDARRLLKGN